MKLLIVHNHFRPGGVRRVIESATPGLARGLRPRLDEVVLVAGESPDANWLQLMVRLCEMAVSCRIEPALSYLAEQQHTPREMTKRVRNFLAELLPAQGDQERLVWAHNQGLARNPILTRELVRSCRRLGVPLVLHHHDWWFDNRWQRWPEIRRSGFRSLRQVAETVFPTTLNVRAAAINQADASILSQHFPEQVAWLPNPVEKAPTPPIQAVREARRWLRQQIGEETPIWLMPCRLVRRKNIAEALLLTRWLRPEAWLVTTGGVSSADEETYCRRLTEAAREHGWPLRLAVLQKTERAKPTVPELMAASEVILSTSLQEGFGLPYVEAASASRPLIARLLPNMTPDLREFGFRFPQGYREVLVAPCLFDWDAEQARQQVLFHRWRTELPRSCRKHTGMPEFLREDENQRPVPFSRLTLAAQLEVLAWPAAESFRRCAPLNPVLKNWRKRAEAGRLEVSPWPKSAARWLSGAAYARRFRELIGRTTTQANQGGASLAAQEQFLRARLAPANLYPLLWSTRV